MEDTFVLQDWLDDIDYLNNRRRAILNKIKSIKDLRRPIVTIRSAGDNETHEFSDENIVRVVTEKYVETLEQTVEQYNKCLSYIAEMGAEYTHEKYAKYAKIITEN